MAHNLSVQYYAGPQPSGITGSWQYICEVYNELKAKKIDIQFISFRGLPMHSNFRWFYTDFATAINRFLLYPTKVISVKNPKSIAHITIWGHAYLAKLFKFRKFVVTCYDLIYYSNVMRTRGLKTLVNKPTVAVSKQMMQKSDGVITLSEYSKKKICETFYIPNTKIVVAPPGIDSRKFFYKPEKNKKILSRWNIPENAKVILYVGSEEPRQNVDKIIEALYHVKKSVDHVYFLKVGGTHSVGARKKNLSLVKELNLQKYVIFTDYIEEALLPEVYRAADVFVYPCGDAGWGIPPQEAMACGAPVITSNLASLPEVVGDAGIKINPYDKKALVENICKVLSDESLKNWMVKKGLARAKEFTWGKTANTIYDLYEKVWLS